MPFSKFSGSLDTPSVKFFSHDDLDMYAKRFTLWAARQLPRSPVGAKED